MKKIEFLDTPTLWKLERKFEAPKNLLESIILRGIRAEISSRGRQMDEDHGDSHECSEYTDLHAAAVDAIEKIQQALPNAA